MARPTSSAPAPARGYPFVDGPQATARETAIAADRRPPPFVPAPRRVHEREIGRWTLDHRSPRRRLGIEPPGNTGAWARASSRFGFRPCPPLRLPPETPLNDRSTPCSV